MRIVSLFNFVKGRRCESHRQLN